MTTASRTVSFEPLEGDEIHFDPHTPDEHVDWVDYMDGEFVVLADGSEIHVSALDVSPDFPDPRVWYAR
jgi:hypothetical protein